MQLGDQVAAALKAVGVTPERVSAWIGRPCGCEERQRKLNALGHWARRLLTGRYAGKAEEAREHLDSLVEEEGL